MKGKGTSWQSGDLGPSPICAINSNLLLYSQLQRSHLFKKNEGGFRSQQTKMVSSRPNPAVSMDFVHSCLIATMAVEQLELQLKLHGPQTPKYLQYGPLEKSWQTPGEVFRWWCRVLVFGGGALGATILGGLHQTVPLLCALRIRVLFKISLEKTIVRALCVLYSCSLLLSYICLP